MWVMGSIIIWIIDAVGTVGGRAEVFGAIGDREYVAAEVAFTKVINYAINFILNEENKMKLNCTIPFTQSSSKLTSRRATASQPPFSPQSRH